MKHAIETGALKPGEQLPSIRPLAEELVMNPSTVAKAYRSGPDRVARSVDERVLATAP